MTFLDLLVLLLVLGLGVFGLIAGFVAEVISLTSYIAVIFGLRILHGPVAGLLGHYVKSDATASVAAFILIFILVFAGGKLLAASLGGRMRKSVLGPFDRVLGFGFGATKGLIIATLVFLMFNLGYDTIFGGSAARPDWMKESRSYPLLNATGRAIVDWMAERRKQDAGPDNATDRANAAEPASN